jgi:hypothetical protein
MLPAPEAVPIPLETPVNGVTAEADAFAPDDPDARPAIVTMATATALAPLDPDAVAVALLLAIAAAVAIAIPEARAVPGRLLGV